MPVRRVGLTDWQRRRFWSQAAWAWERSGACGRRTHTYEATVVKGAGVPIPVHRNARRAPHSPITRHYEDLKERLGWRKARVAAARKLARTIYQMLRTGEVWRETNGDPNGTELQHAHVAYDHLQT